MCVGVCCFFIFWAHADQFFVLFTGEVLGAAAEVGKDKRKDSPIRGVRFSLAYFMQKKNSLCFC
jgi:hypothetical protein